ncbi:autoinducer binding domain-containing protein (plasmid) [Aureimonas ureilytica]|uniref:helix-turn-helix transcriptional regulator n=1 Tax=Aureimonas ureilytica TaxID=401562 RepID=UPI003CEB92FF
MNGGETLETEEMLAAIETADTIADLTALLQRFVQAHGFSGFSFMDAGSVLQSVPFFVGTSGAAWEEEYRSNRFFQFDPCVDQARRTNRPFLWSDITLPAKAGGRKSGALRTMEAARDHHFTNGVTIPYHFTDHLGRVFSSSSVFFWKSRREELVALFARPRIRHDLHLVMLYWSQRMMDVTARERAQPQRFLDEDGNPLVEVNLTDRERDVLAWAANGKTVPETAIILSVSEETVGTHMRNAMRKLGSETKTHAVVKAIYLNLINL